MSKSELCFAVIGAGGGGQAMAGYLAAMGFRTNLYNRTPSKIEKISQDKGLHLRGIVRTFAPLNRVTSDLRAAVEGADVIMVAVPACGHRDIARRAAAHLQPGQIVVLNPGRTGGALEFRSALDRCGVPPDITVAEAQTFIFASRVTGPAEATIFGMKKTVPLAALPAARTGQVLRYLRLPFPQFRAAENVLATSMNNIGAIFHPAPTILNAVRIEEGLGFEYYRQGMTRTVTRVLERMDAERCRVSRALDFEPLSSLDFLRRAYGVRAESLHEALRANPHYRGIASPGTLAHRYIVEDVPFGLVPMASLGRMLGVPTPTIDAIIQLACALHARDYWAEGRTVETLGLHGLSVEQIWNLVDGEPIEQLVG